MRKIIFTIFAATALSLAIGTSNTEASTYTVKPGDTLWKIASSNNISVTQLLTWNNLQSNSIHPNQTLKVSATLTSVPTPKPLSVSKPPVGSVNTYTVKSGDTLSRIARIHNTSVSTIQQLNKLSGNNIVPGQKLIVSGKALTTKPTATVKVPASIPTASNTSTYVVVSGDTLSNIAKRHNTSVAQLMSLNDLKSASIRIGQILKISLKSSTESLVAVSNPIIAPSISSGSISTLINSATSFLGTPYKWGGAAPGGFDCSGYIYYVYNQAGFSVPRTNTTGFYALSSPVSSPEVGDLVFFKNTYRPGISHMGIFIGNNSFIHAGGDRVQITSLNDKYWGSKFDSYQRLNVMK